MSSTNLGSVNDCVSTVGVLGGVGVLVSERSVGVEVKVVGDGVNVRVGRLGGVEVGPVEVGVGVIVNVGLD